MEIKGILTTSIARANNLTNWLIPRLCLSCGKHTENEIHPCCDACYANLPFQTHCCRQCGQTLGAKLDYCGRCLESPPAFDACYCPFSYEAPISDHIQKFKYGERPELAKSLAQLLCHEVVANDLEMPELLIPVPLHKTRLRTRGFNQSLQLAKEISKLLDIPYSNNILEKSRTTPAQAQLKLKERKKNLRGSFSVVEKPSAKNIAIIDDVFTTGTTANEITKQLKRNGVHYVQVWGIAHTV